MTSFIMMKTPQGSRSSDEVRGSGFKSGRWEAVWLRRIVMTVACVCFMSLAMGKPAAPAAPAQSLASAGFFEHPSASAYLLGFSSSAYVGEQGIWGLLLITQEQGAQLRQAFAETRARAFEDPSMDNEEKKRLEVEFNSKVREILTEDQKQMVSDVNRLVKEWSESGSGGESGNGYGADGPLYERLKTIATPEQLANFDALRGQKP